MTQPDYAYDILLDVHVTLPTYTYDMSLLNAHMENSNLNVCVTSIPNSLWYHP